MSDRRTELGFERTVCDCRGCKINCKFIFLRAGYSTHKRFVLGGEECAAPFSSKTVVAYRVDDYILVVRNRRQCQARHAIYRKATVINLGENGSYSQRKAVIGSPFVARRAGK